MNILFKWMISLLLLLSVNGQVLADSANTATQATLSKSPVWQVTKNGRSLFLGGAVHLLSSKDYPLPPGFAFAYHHSNVLVTEVDLRETQTPQFQQHFLMAMRYPYGETLQQHLSPAVYTQLTDFLKLYGVDINKMRTYRAGLASMNITLLALKKLKMAGTGVDNYYTQQASKDRKPILALETPAEHLRFMTSMGVGHEDAMILQSIEETHHLAATMNDMKKYWRTGNLEGFDHAVLMPFETQFPSIYHAIIVKRNQNWLPKIEALVKSSPTEFLLVGTLHLVGKQGLLHQLAIRGYQIQQLP